MTTSTQRQREFFYGWVIVGVLAISRGLGLALGMLNFGLFITPMGNELSIGRSTFGWASSARTVTSAITSPLLGRLVDQFGSRYLLAISAALIGITLFWMGYIVHSWQMVTLFAVAGLMPVSGPAALVTTVPVSKWFVRKRGRAVGWLLLVNSFAAIALMPLSQVLIDVLGWRAAWMVIGSVAAGIIVPLSLVFVRRVPEDLGLAPDGADRVGESINSIQSEDGGSGKVLRTDEVSWTVREAISSSAFWRLLIASSVIMFATSTMVLHRLPHFVDRGLDPQLVASSIGVEIATAGMSIFILGYMAERMPSRYLSGTATIVSAVAVLLTITTETPFTLFVSMGTFGIGVGGGQLLRDFIWAEYFGRQHLGSIRGVVSPVILTFGAMGAPLAGYVWDSTGSYGPVWWVSVGLFLFAAIVLYLTPPPKKRIV